jgi:hypothetical protein
MTIKHVLMVQAAGLSKHLLVILMPYSWGFADDEPQNWGDRQLKLG